jgi:small GTP-binding protein
MAATGPNEFRAVVVGAGGVGKSALTVRFVQGNFVEKYDPTIEDSYRKQMEVDKQVCMLDIMDTAGQEEYNALRDSYMKTGQGFLIVYDISASQSFELATKLHLQVLRLKEDTPDIPIILVGNKSDLDKNRKVAPEKAQAFADQHKLGFVETSAKTNANVTEVFMDLVRRMRQWRELHPSQAPAKKSGFCLLL